MSEKNKFTLRPSESILLASLPIVGVYIPFLFQWGCFIYFGIPASLIDVDVQKIVLSTVVAAVAVLIFAMIFSFVIDFYKSGGIIIRLICRILFTVTIFLPFIFVIYSIWQKILVLICLIVMASTEFFEAFEWRKGDKSYAERLEQAVKKSSENESPKNVKQFFGDAILAPFCFFILCSIYVVMLGYYCGPWFVGGTHLKDNQNLIFVGRNNDSYIFVVIDPATKKFGKNFVVRDSSNPIELTVKQGALKSLP